MGTLDDITKTFVRPAVGAQREYLIKDLRKLTKAQLLELRDRQKDILSKKSRLAHLPDKGKRIEEFYARILSALKEKDEIEIAAEMFSVLNISSKGTKFVTNLEWTGEMDTNNLGENVEVEVEDETDPLKIIAQSRAKQKIVKIEKPEESLITPSDLKDFEEVQKLNLSSSSTSSQWDSHATYLCDKEALPGSTREKFRPYQTTKTNVHDPELETKKVFKYSEITAATPPHLRHPGTKMLTLQQSLELQIEKEKEMKQINQREAEQRLAAKATQLGEKSRDFVAKDMNEFFKTYRVANESSDEAAESSSDDEWDSAEEVLDIDAREETGGVHFTVKE